MKLALQEEEEDPTPLQVKLEGLAEDIGKVGLIASLLTMGVLIIYIIIDLCEGEVLIKKYKFKSL